MDVNQSLVDVVLRLLEDSVHVGGVIVQSSDRCDRQVRAQWVSMVTDELVLFRFLIVEDHLRQLDGEGSLLIVH